MGTSMVGTNQGRSFQDLEADLEWLVVLVNKAGSNLTPVELAALNRERKRIKHRLVQLARSLEREFSCLDGKMRDLFGRGEFARPTADYLEQDPAAGDVLLQKARHLHKLASLGHGGSGYLKFLFPDYKLLVNRYLYLVQVGGFSSLGIRQGIQDCLGETLGLIKDKPNRQNG